MNEHDDAYVDAMLRVNMQANTRSVTLRLLLVLEKRMVKNNIWGNHLKHSLYNCRVLKIHCVPQSGKFMIKSKYPFFSILSLGVFVYF